jgi:hypothetical protein
MGKFPTDLHNVGWIEVLEGSVERWAFVRVRRRQLMTQRYIIMLKLIDSVLSILSVFIQRWEIQTYVHRTCGLYISTR